MTRFHHGMNLRDFEREFLAVEGLIVSVRRTGERRYSHPLISRRPRINGRRKDAPRDLTQFAMEIERLINERAVNDDHF